MVSSAAGPKTSPRPVQLSLSVAGYVHRRPSRATPPVTCCSAFAVGSRSLIVARFVLPLLRSAALVMFALDLDVRAIYFLTSAIEIVQRIDSLCASASLNERLVVRSPILLIHYILIGIALQR